MDESVENTSEISLKCTWRNHLIIIIHLIIRILCDFRVYFTEIWNEFNFYDIHDWADPYKLFFASEVVYHVVEKGPLWKNMDTW